MRSVAEPSAEPTRFRILGPLEAWSGEHRLRLGGAVQARVLGTLLLERGRVLPIARLIEATWGYDPPSTASHQVRKAVADLRHRLPDGTALLATDGPGYRAVIADAQLDLGEFARQVRDADRAVADGRLTAAAELLTSALALWQGPVLSGLGGPVIEAAAVPLEESRLGAAERLIDIRLGLGEAAELIVELRQLVEDHPLRENLRAQLMVALCRSGRQAEALEEYGRVRALLVEELGIDPGPALSRVYEGILQESPDLAAPPRGIGLPPVPAVPSAPAIPPSTLPLDLADFTGRESELTAVLAAAASGLDTRVVAIDGMGGSGKTSLAVHAAHRLADDYPDAQLYLDLRGYTPDGQSISAGVALDHLLHAMGVPRDQIPDDLIGQTTLWRATLATKRVLLLLDNVAGDAVIRPLLPASPGCVALVTSRARLVDLDGARWVSIGTMSTVDSARLITATLGADRVEAEPAAAHELAVLCAGLPLALRIATARLRNRPRWTIQYMVDRLRDETHRLDELSSGERGVAMTLRLSYQALNEGCRRALRLLSVHPGDAIDLHSAAAVLALDMRTAEEVLEALLDVHLLEQPAIGLYGFHDLVRSFAAGMASGPAGDDGAFERLLEYLLSASEAACEAMFSGRARRPTGIRETAARLPELGRASSAEAWTAQEQTTLLATVTMAHRRGFDRHAACLARNIGFWLNSVGMLNEFGELGRLAVAAARRTEDPALLSTSLSNLGVACWKLGRYDEGMQVAREAHAIAVRLGDRHTEAHSNGVLGLYNSLLGRFPEALTHLRAAVEQGRALGASRAEAESLTALSALYEQQGEYELAAEAACDALDLGRRLAQHEIVLVAVNDVALAYIGLGKFVEAEQWLAQGRDLCDGSNEAGHEAMTFALSADVAVEIGSPSDTAGYTARAVGLVDYSASPLRRAKVHNILARLYARQGEHVRALGAHAHAHRIAASVSYRAEEAYALLGMARVHELLGDDPAAREHFAEAEDLYLAMDVAEPRQRR